MHIKVSENYISDRISFCTRTSTKRGLFVTGTMYPHITGGMEIFNYYFLKRRFSESNNQDSYISEKPLPGYEEKHLKVLKIWPLTIFYPLQHAWYFITMRRKYDFVNVSFSEQSFLISFIQALVLTTLRKPFYVTIFWGHIPKWKWLWPMRFFFNHAACTITVSKSLDRRYALIFPKAKFQYIPPLIPYITSDKPKSFLRKKNGLMSEQFVFLFCGTLKQMKNPDIIVKAAEKIGQEYLKRNNIRFIFVGHGPMMDELKQQVGGSSICDHVQFFGHVSEEVKHEYYQLADAYIICSDYEGNSLSLLEAMSNALPILASDVPGINNVVKNKHSAFLFENRNSKELADKICECFENKQFSVVMGKNARIDHDKMLNFEAMIDMYDELFQG